MTIGDQGNTLELRKISASWLALVVPVLGAAIFYLWQPVTDYFVTGAFDENVVLQIDAETIKSDTKNPLLVIHVKATNRGNVPVTIKSDGGVGQIALQVRRIENPVEAKWIEPEKLALVAETNALRKHNGGYVIAPNAFYEELEALSLPSGIYWIKGSIIFENGEYIDQLDLPPTSRTKLRLVKSVKLEQDGHEEEQIYRRTDHWLSQTGRGRYASQGALPQWRVQ